MKTRLLQIIYVNPFAGLDHENPFTHLIKFYKLAGTLGACEVEEEAVFMRLFTHSLIGKAKDGYLNQPTQIMTNWNILEEKFMNQLFLYSMFLDENIIIIVFVQGSTETLCETWEHKLYMLNKCPSHGFDDITKLHILRSGLQAHPKILLDATTSDSLMSNSAKDEISIID